jgi:hypothetical protein
MSPHTGPEPRTIHSERKSQVLRTFHAFLIGLSGVLSQEAQHAAGVPLLDILLFLQSPLDR